MAENVAGKKEEKQQQGNKKNNKNQQQTLNKKGPEASKPKHQQLVQPSKKEKSNSSNSKTNNSNASKNNGKKLFNVNALKSPPRNLNIDEYLSTYMKNRITKKNSSNNNNNNSNSNKKHKEKKENRNQGNKNVKRSVNKPSGGICRTLFKLSFFAAAAALMFLGFLYIVDVNRYRSVVKGGGNALYGVREYLPVELVVQGEKVYMHYVKPTVEVAVDKVLVLVNQTSTVLRTNPALKDHWSNINEISAVIGERLAEYMRTVYNKAPIYYDYAKNKLF